MLRHIVFLAAIGAACAGHGQAPILRMRGGGEMADVGRAQAPLKRANAFKIARVLSEHFDQTGIVGGSADGPVVTNERMAKKMHNIGYKGDDGPAEDPMLTAYVNLKLAAVGVPMSKMHGREHNFMRLVEPILKSYQEQQHILNDHGFALCPADQRIQNFLNDYLAEVGEEIPVLPSRQLKLDRHGLAKMLSLPKGEDFFQNDIITSYRVAQGVLHNPKNDKRTTAGVFHVTEGGLPVSHEKKQIPKIAFLRLLKEALRPPADLLTLPYTANAENKAEVWTSLLLRPLSCPEVDGFTEEKSNEVRFIAPGSMVSNLDFVESIFGNGDNPDLAENDAALDPEHWTGTTGAVILAPHLIRMKKKDMGLPHVSKATEREKRDGMCYEKDDELYNNGGAFKICARDARGVMVTVIADNYFGYCKKEVKTQLAYTANIYGMTEEEHAGGCLAYPSYDLGGEFCHKDLGKVAGKGAVAYLGDTHKHFTETEKQNSFKEIAETYADLIDVKPEGYAVDKEFDDIIYLPEDATFSLEKQSITWNKNGEQKINLKPKFTYILPSGYKVEMVKKGDNTVGKKAGSTSANQYTKWHLKGTVAEGSFLHKPATVSGGGKSEISKRIEDMVRYGPVFTAGISEDFDQIEKIIKHDYSKMMKDGSKDMLSSLGLKDFLDPKLSLGRMISILTPSPEFSVEHNTWISGIATHVRELICVLKQNYKSEWGDDWRRNFHTDAINGALGHEVKSGEGSLLSSYIRVGFRSKHDETIPLKGEDEGRIAWKTFTLRQDFFPSWKLQTEDDITASVVVPSKSIKGLSFREKQPSLKFSQNCEFRLFQRPDEAIHRGFDKTTELDMSKPGNFISNFQPLTRDEVKALHEDTIGFQKFSEPMQKLLLDFINADSPDFCVSSSNPRIVDGKPTANPRYLQDSQEVTNTRQYHVSAMATRIARKLPAGAPVHTPVNAVLCGRRNNPPDANSKPPQPALAVHNPVHYYELPEFLMECTSSMTGKSPSTTGAGSEGALTKGPFNALNQIHDLNNAFVSYALTGYQPFITSAGVIGPNHQVDHDISLLVPEVWCRMRNEERDANNMIKNGYLEKIEDIQVDGKDVPASVLGFRITQKFVNDYFGRVVADPSTLFSPSMLKPETQCLKTYAEGVETITVTNKRVAQLYFDDGAIEYACPPMKAVLHLMRDGEYEGMKATDPKLRAMFTRDAVLKSDWYKERLTCFQKMEEDRLTKGIKYMEEFVNAMKGDDWKGHQIVDDLHILARLDKCKKRLDQVKSKNYLDSIHGSIGVDPAIYSVKGNNYHGCGK